MIFGAQHIRMEIAPGDSPFSVSQARVTFHCNHCGKSSGEIVGPGDMPTAHYPARDVWQIIMGAFTFELTHAECPGPMYEPEPWVMR